MITVHHLENSRSQRVLWLLEELGLDYRIKRYERDPQTMLAPDSLKEVHPLGKSPVIEVDDRRVAETGAIVEYLVDRYDDGKLRPPKGTDERLAYTYWLHFAEGSMMPLLLLGLVLDKQGQSPVPMILRPAGKLLGGGVKLKFLTPRLDAQLGYIEDTLGESDWFAGDEFTAADIQMSFPLEALDTRFGTGKTYPKIGAWLKRIHARAAYVAALESGGPYAYA
jgi:glutathione S-transferase